MEVRANDKYFPVCSFRVQIALVASLHIGTMDTYE